MAVNSTTTSIKTITGLTTSAGAWTACTAAIPCSSACVQNNATNGAVLQISTDDTTATTDTLDIAGGSYFAFTWSRAYKGVGETIVNARWKTIAGDVNPSLVLTF